LRTGGRGIPGGSALWVALAATVVALALVPGAATAAEPLAIESAIDRGVTQLEGVQLPDGGFGERLPVRDSATVAEALRVARPQSEITALVASFLAPLALENVEVVARASLASPALGYARQLSAHQNADGGFGLSGEYQSDALDTALALRALTALGERDAARRAADRLLRFASAGAWGADGGEVAVTSEALLALDAYVRAYGSTTAINTALAGA
jgi:hypothetical protein